MNSTSNPCTLAIADSSALFRLGVRNMARTVDGIAVVGEASTGEDLIELTHSFEVDVVVIDFLAEGFDIDDVRRLKTQRPGVRVLAITDEQRGHTIVNALKAGVDSYIKKNCDLGEVEEAIRETSQGGAFFCGQILEEIRRESIDVSELDALPISCDPVLLSAREMEVLQLIAEGFTNTQMADKLFLSAHTGDDTQEKHHGQARREQHGRARDVRRQNGRCKPQQVPFSGGNELTSRQQRSL